MHVKDGMIPPPLDEFLYQLTERPSEILLGPIKNGQDDTSRGNLEYEVPGDRVRLKRGAAGHACKASWQLWIREPSWIAENSNDDDDDGTFLIMRK